MSERLNADLRTAILDGIAGGEVIPADDVFAERNARYAEPKQATTKPGGKRAA